MRRVRAEAGEIVAFGETILAFLAASQGSIVDRQHQSARRRGRLWLHLAFHGFRPALGLGKVRVGIQDFLKPLRRPFRSLTDPRGAGQPPSSARAGAAQPTIPFIGTGFRGIEPFPRSLIHLVLAVDEPARCEADELFVQELDRLIRIQGRTT
jgi:hypothetical protein